MSFVVRKPAFAYAKTKAQIREADLRLCVRYAVGTIPVLPKYKILSLLPSSALVQPGLCGTWSKTRTFVFS